MELTAGHVWLMVAAALVLFMTPGLAFFYGGMTRAKAALNMMMMSFISIGMVGVVWVLWGASMSSGEGFLQIVGNPFATFGLEGITTPDGLIKVGYAATFAIITVALISGAIADRAKFGAWTVFVPVWVTLVYCPLAYMVWGGGLFGAGRRDRQGPRPGHRLRRRHRGPHQRRCGGTDPRSDHRQPQGLRQGPEPPPAQHPVRYARRGYSVVRLVRLQRRRGHHG